MNALVKRGDKTELNDRIGEAEALDKAEYTSNTWAALEKPLEAAKAVAADEDATQAEVDEAKAALDEAMNALVKRGDKTELNDWIGEAEKLKEEDYTADSWSKLEDALEDAKKVAADEDATQAEIDAAKATLSAAVKGVEKKPVTPADPEKPAPDTGDYAPVAMPLVLALAAAAGAVMFFRKRKSAR